MNVLKIVIVSLVFLKLFAIDLYVPINYKTKIKNVNIKYYINASKLDFNNSLALISYNDIPLILEKNLTVIIPIGELKEYIVTYKKSLSEINTIANLDFASKIVLDTVNTHYKSVKGNLKDFLRGKIDAIVVFNKSIEKEAYFDFPLKLYGIDFNKYFIVTTKDFIKTHYKEIEKLTPIFENKFPFKKSLVYKTFIISALYLNKHIDFNKILFENYQLKEEIKEKILIVDVTSNWPPFDIYQNGRLYGIGVDFWKLIAKKAGLRYKFHIKKKWSEVLEDIKNKKADLTINTSATKDREKFAIFSKPYVSFPLAIICRSNENFNSINDIKTIAVGKNFTAEKLMKKHYPHIHYIETTNIFEALNLVKKKRAQCAVDILPTILWTINKYHLINLQIAFTTPFKFHVQIMIRKDKPQLLAKINKAIESITPKEKEEILNRYLQTIIIQKRNHLDFEIFIILGIIGIIIMFGIYILHKKKVKNISLLAERDELTSILNRRGVLEKVKEIEKGSILFFDIDYFKKINDTYGHDFGDYVLKEIGKILKNTFRKSDIIGRWGGEEFIVILPNTKYEDALRLAEKLRKIVEDYDFNGKKVTISIGVSEYKGDFEEALKKADEALYEAKHAGRNQVKGKR